MGKSLKTHSLSELVDQLHASLSAFRWYEISIARPEQYSHWGASDTGERDISFEVEHWKLDDLEAKLCDIAEHWVKKLRANGFEVRILKEVDDQPIVRVTSIEGPVGDVVRAVFETVKIRVALG
jgi:hypothetical protein